MAARSRIDGLAVGLIAAGGLIAYAGIRGKSIPGAVSALIQGQSPATAAPAAPIAQVTQPAGSEPGAGPNSPVSPTGTFSNNLMYVAEYMTVNGYSQAAAAGIASCVDGESGGNPEAQGSGGRGLIGWTPPSTLADSAFTGNPQNDLPAQCAQILAYNNAQGSGLIAMLNAQTTPIGAAMFYSLHFERPLIPYSDVRPITATSVYAALQKGGTSPVPTG